MGSQSGGAPAAAGKPGGRDARAGAATVDGRLSLEELTTSPRAPGRTVVMPAASSQLIGADRGGQSTEVQVLVHNMPVDAPLDSRLVLLREPTSERAAAFRVLRHHLQQGGDPKVVAVTSARDREGKTTCAVNLALALAERSHSRVLLIEANLHAPQLAAMFGFQPPWCFAEQLAAHREQPMMSWVVAEVAPLGLRVAAVNPTAKWRPVLDALAFFIAVERFRMTDHDYIVIDSPSVLGSADVNMIQDAADGVILTASSGSSRAGALRRAIEQLHPGAILGTVLLDAAG